MALDEYESLMETGSLSCSPLRIASPARIDRTSRDMATFEGVPIHD